MTKPSITIILLDELESLGFDNTAFSALHHFREKGRRETIKSHRKYCENTRQFKENDNNLQVQRRLRLVLNAYVLGGFESQYPEVFLGLAEAAYKEISPSREEK